MGANDLEGMQLFLQSEAARQMPSLPDCTRLSTGQLQAIQLLTHWRTMRPSFDPSLLLLCFRCGNGTAPTCRFHPDAKAFAFGSGRFDYGYETLWDTPHDCFLCCGNECPSSEGCTEQSQHILDIDWWKAYDHLAPPLDEESEENEEESDGSDVEHGSNTDDCMSATMDLS
jgi:hypothetical protein